MRHAKDLLSLDGRVTIVTGVRGLHGVFWNIDPRVINPGSWYNHT